jgi:hypothetical protein
MRECRILYNVILALMDVALVMETTAITCLDGKVMPCSER